ncbi:MAG: DJ-1/PfpI family protein [Bacteroidia bacterium]|nr:DJ-1/PfpI family protein [Bacteroidia bacterium]
MPTKFTFLILPQIHILDLAGPDQAIHEAIDYKADFEIEYCGLNETVITSSGLPFGTVKHFSETKLSKGDYLMIPGAAYSYLTSSEFLQRKGLFEWIRELHQNGTNICSICMGAFVMAESGLLNNKKCTTHFKKTRELQERYPKIKVQENILYTDEDNLYTSAGIAAGIDLTLHIIEKLKGSYFVHLVARELVVYNRRKGNDVQESEFLKFRNHIHSGIHRVQDFIIDHIQNKHPLRELADIANMSERNLTRIFKKETGITIIEYITKIRRTLANELIKNPDLSKIEVANKVGLLSERQLMRILKEQ